MENSFTKEIKFLFALEKLHKQRKKRNNNNMDGRKYQDAKD